MGDLERDDAVEPPVVGAAPGGGMRLHRRLTGLSGILLFVCMVLPAVKSCGQPVTPLEVPPFLPPYLYGLVLALIAMSRTSRGLAYGATALRVLAALIVLGSVVLVVIAPEIGVVELLIGVVLQVTIGVSRTTELRVVATGILVSLGSILWFGMWSVTSDALIGVYCSLASSIGLLAGCLGWLRELVIRRPVDVPRAVAVMAARPPAAPARPAATDCDWQ
jgi:hypothetical protein